MPQKIRPVPKVVDADEMDDAVFIMHFDNRHDDQLPGLPNGMLKNIHPDTLESYRIFHDQLHRFYILEHPHEHE